MLKDGKRTWLAFDRQDHTVLCSWNIMLNFTTDLIEAVIDSGKGLSNRKADVKLDHSLLAAN